MAEDSVVRILAAGDLHLGMRFATYPEVAEELSGQRYRTLGRIVSLAHEENCDLLVIAGDLFDRVNVAKKDVIKAAAILNQFQGKGVCVLPGNHDHFIGTGSSLWNVFREEAGGNVLFLGQQKPYSLRHLDLDILVLPGPCNSKHSPLHSLSWITNENIGDDHSLILGIAHGSVEGISPDSNDQYFPMNLELFDTLPAHLWILGHTHLTQEHRRQNCTVVIPGTPEPDGFDCTQRGMVCCIEAAGRNRINVGKIESGTYVFKRDVREITGPEDLESILRGTEEEKGDKTLLKLTLKGRVAGDTFRAVNELRGSLSERLFYCEVDDSFLSLKITKEMIEKEFSQGSFPYLLLSELLEQEESEALHTAYDLLQEART